MDEIVSLKNHQPCPECGSSDALTINSDGSTKCFSCDTWTPSKKASIQTVKNELNDGFIRGEVKDITSRGIHADTCKKYGYQLGKVNGSPCHIANFYNLDGKPIAQKYRMADKQFRCSGTPNYFFGQHLWPNGFSKGKLVVTEGEIDCLSVSQMQGNKWPCVSLPSGAQSAKAMFKKHMEWLNRFQEVILMFDMDDKGQQAVEDAVHILPPGKAKVAKLPLKDPNDMLLAGRSQEVISAIWEAKVWRPDDIVPGDELYERLANPKTYESTPYPWSGLNNITRGIQKGSLVTFCAGSGQGKSQICKQVAHHILTTTEKKVGYIALEENIERTALGVVGLELGKQLHLEPFEATDDFKVAYDKTVGSGRFFLYDHFGSTESENLISRIRYLIKTFDTEFIVLDHLSIVVSGIGDGDERRLIDNTMTKLRSLVEETGVAMLLVSHLRRPEGRGHEEGAATSLAQLRGSAAIAQLSDMVIGLERDQQCSENKNTTIVRVLKNRFSGETGVACELNFDIESGRLNEFRQPTVEVDDVPF